MSYCYVCGHELKATSCGFYCTNTACPSNISEIELLTLKVWEQEVKRTMPELDRREATLNFLLGMAGEGGEIHELWKKHFFHGHELKREKLVDELGDYFWYPIALAITHDITLEEIFIRNREKLRERYPEGFSKLHSINRKENK